MTTPTTASSIPATHLPMNPRGFASEGIGNMWRRAAMVCAASVSAMVSGLAPAASAATLDWQPCREKALKGLQCATATVPKDYADPSKGSFELAVVRAKATGTPGQRIGSLFFNPGGPGASGVSLAPDVLAALPKAVRQRFDFVTWDPRGVARSSGLECDNGQYTLPATGPVDWTAVTEQMRASEKAANEGCAQTNPDVVPYIGTNNTVRDLDRLRAAVGDDKLTYWGTSYGTRIGAVYAHMFPKNVRAMLLSSPVDPNADWTSFATEAGVSPDNAVGFFFEAFPKSRKTYTRVVKDLSTAALTLPSGAQVTHWDIQAIVANSVISQNGYSAASDLLSTTDTAINDKGKARRRALATLDQQQWLPSYPINGGATAFVGCLDLPERFTAERQDALAARLRAQAPIFGFGTSQALFYCEGVNVTPDPVATDYLNTSTPMLIIGSTRDALTNYEWATDMARTFRNSRVITYVGTVHTPVFTSGSACLDNAATEYLVSRKRPRVDTSCRNTVVR